MIIAASSGNNLTNVLEQRLEISRKRITGRVQVAHHLVQIISKPYKLTVDKPFGVATWLTPAANLNFLTEQECSSKMHGPHSNRFGARFNVGELARREADIKLFDAWLEFLWLVHVAVSWQSACVLGLGGHLSGPQRESLCLGKGHLATLSPIYSLNHLFPSRLRIIHKPNKRSS
jgi:hypothetical protein